DISDSRGNVVMRRSVQHKLTQENYPDTVNPYLWRNYVDGYDAGVLKVSEGFYIVYGVDSSAIGFAKGEKGWVIIDTGGSFQAGQLAISLIKKAIGEDVVGKVSAVIYSHTHTDHLGGILAFADLEDFGKKSEGKIPIYGPKDFAVSLVDDNLYAGVQMSRRLQYQCGLYLDHSSRGRVSIGLASTLGVRGHIDSLLPTELIEADETVEIDGIHFEFLQAQNTETRAHMVAFIQEYKVLFLGDVGVGSTIHNTYTMRGAPVRDANYWGKLFYRLYLKYGDRVECVFNGHGQPHFNSETRPDKVKRYLLDTAAAYKYTHDQALLLANEGKKIQEVGNEIEIPDSIKKTWYTRAHYGNYSFNARGTVQRYLGFYDGNPINLNPLPDSESAKKFVEYAGSQERIIELAKKDFEQGQYQWVASVSRQVLLYNPDNKDAAYLLADSLEQLGYLSDNALQRNAYLTAALDIRHPEIYQNINIRAMDNSDVIPLVSVDLLLDYLGINFDGFAGQDLRESFVIKVVTDNNTGQAETHRIEVYKGTVFHEQVTAAEEVDVTVDKDYLYQVAAGKVDPAEIENESLSRLAEYIVNTEKFKQYSLVL
ncbi:MAG: alkyl sulfatase dimerization domain-containing protein, partial [Lachnospiraceae bacterium]|nr:alkyl sulfatase dimerization domain-containing protein [Lachnospiraceae bacterium]